MRTDGSALMLPQFYRGRDGHPAFAVESFYDVLTGKIPASKYADKIVVIGATAAGVGVQFPVPGNPALSPAETVAHITSSILNEHFIVQPSWGLWASMGAFLLIAAYVGAALPRLTAGKSALITLGLLVLLLATEFGLLSASATWLKLVFPAVALVLGHLALTTKRFLMTEAGKVKSDEESAETNRMMGLALQGQGQLDMAFDRFRRVPMGEAVMGNLYSLPMNYFEALPELIEKRIAGMQLEGIPKENPFEVPANYFERLDSEIIDHVIASKTQKGFHWITQLVRPKLVVSFATIAFAVFVVFKVSTLNKVDKYSFSEQEIANSNVLNDIDEGTIIETLYSETATNAIPKQGEMEKYLLDNNVDESQLTGTL